MQVTLNAPLPDGTPLLDTNNHAVGTLTSSATYPAGVKGLAVIKTGAAIAGALLHAEAEPPVEVVLQELAGYHERM
jgi:hypothetical protein